MTSVIFPDENWVYRFNNVEGTDPIIVSGKTLISIINTESNVKIYSNDISSEFEAYLLATYDDGLIISNESQITINVRASEVPSNFDKFEIYLEDGNQRIATYAIENSNLGRVERFNLRALVKDDGFNESYVVRIGLHVKSPSSTITTFSLVLSRMALTSSPIPHYADPQDVIDMLQLRNNDGSPFVLSESTSPSYDTVANLLVQAENYVEEQTRCAWTERRVVGEIKNPYMSSWTTSPYAGLMFPGNPTSMTGMTFKGVPVQLNYSNVCDIDGNKGDKIEVRTIGNTWVDITTDIMSSTNILMDSQKGILYIRQQYFLRDTSVRITYRYGYGPVPDDMKRAVIIKAMIHILETDLYRFKYPQSPGTEQTRLEVAKTLAEELNKLISSRICNTVIGGI